jgi:MFS transporter, DHA1 family, inner membrane transport protein
MTTIRPSAPIAIPPADPTVRRLAIFALALGGFGIGTNEFVSMGLLPEIASSLGITEPTAGHAISAYALGVVVGAPVLTALSARVPRKTLLLALMTVFVLGNAATVLAPTYELLVAARFVCGLPHGAFFGVAALVAMHLMGPGQQAKAVARVMTGQTIATVIGVPIASWLGQGLGWRAAFVLVVATGLATLTAIDLWIPDLRSMHITSVVTELGALKRLQVWLAMAVGTVGFGGMFAVYTYISSTLTDVTLLPRTLVPVALIIFGMGMVIGNLLGGRMADRSVIPALYVSIGALGVVLAVFVISAHEPFAALPLMLGIGATSAAITPALQARLIDVAADAQTLAGALTHCALNIGNASGAWIGGLVIAAGYGYTAPAAAGAVLAATALIVLTASVLVQSRAGRPAHTALKGN